MRLHPIALASILCLFLCGCAGNQQQQQFGDKAQPSDALPAKEQPFTAETRFAAGQVDEAQHNPSGAVIQYQEALKLNPKHLGALYRLGIVYAELKEYPQAIDTWGQYVAATNESPTAYGDMAFCEELAGETDKAAASYEAGIARDPRSIPCRVNYGLMLARQGRVDDAVTQWRFVLTDAEIHYNLGGVYEAQGNKAKARVEFNKALELNPNFNDARVRVSSLDTNQ
jgi:tetratricopeptide (TPR) repeat protein